MIEVRKSGGHEVRVKIGIAMYSDSIKASDFLTSDEYYPTKTSTFLLFCCSLSIMPSFINMVRCEKEAS